MSGKKEAFPGINRSTSAPLSPSSSTSSIHSSLADLHSHPFAYQHGRRATLSSFRRLSTFSQRVNEKFRPFLAVDPLFGDLALSKELSKELKEEQDDGEKGPQRLHSRLYESHDSFNRQMKEKKKKITSKTVGEDRRRRGIERGHSFHLPRIPKRELKSGDEGSPSMKTKEKEKEKAEKARMESKIQNEEKIRSQLESKLSALRRNEAFMKQLKTNGRKGKGSKESAETLVERNVKDVWTTQRKEERLKALQKASKEREERLKRATERHQRTLEQFREDAQRLQTKYSERDPCIRVERMRVLRWKQEIFLLAMKHFAVMKLLGEAMVRERERRAYYEARVPQAIQIQRVWKNSRFRQSCKEYLIPRMIIKRRLWRMRIAQKIRTKRRSLAIIHSFISEYKRSVKIAFVFNKFFACVRRGQKIIRRFLFATRSRKALLMMQWKKEEPKAREEANKVVLEELKRIETQLQLIRWRRTIAGAKGTGEESDMVARSILLRSRMTLPIDPDIRSKAVKQLQIRSRKLFVRQVVAWENELRERQKREWYRKMEIVARMKLGGQREKTKTVERPGSTSKGTGRRGTDAPTEVIEMEDISVIMPPKPVQNLLVPKHVLWENIKKAFEQSIEKVEESTRRRVLRRVTIHDV